MTSTVVAATAIVAAAQDAGARAYVQASRATVRSQPTAGAPVVGYVTANTELTVVQRGSEWCEIQAPSVKGFMSCRLVGPGRLTLAAIVTTLERGDLSPRERLDWVSRAFWVSPSLTRLEWVADAMEHALAPIEKEMQEGRRHRPANGEFEAMKQRLQSDVPAPADGVPPPPTTTREADASVNPERISAGRPSFFAKDDALFAIPLKPFSLRDAFETGSVLADAASVLGKVSYRARIGGIPGFGTDGPLGAWDADVAEVAFSRPVHITGITAAGAPVGYELSGFVTTLGKRQCGEGPALSIRGRGTAGWNSAIIAWIGRDAPPGKATVSRHTLPAPNAYDKRVVETVDLDGDAIPEFSLWSGLDRAVASTDTRWKAVFANLGGTWRLVAYRQEEDCT